MLQVLALVGPTRELPPASIHYICSADSALVLAMLLIALQFCDETHCMSAVSECGESALDSASTHLLAASCPQVNHSTQLWSF